MSTMSRSVSPLAHRRVAVLVVDEKPEERGQLRSMLERERAAWEVLEAGSAAECLALLAARAVHVVLLEVILRGGGGLELCKAIKRRHRVPVVFVSGVATGVNHRVLGLDSGADDYITRPTSSIVLAARLEAILRRWWPEGLRVVAG